MRRALLLMRRGCGAMLLLLGLLPAGTSLASEEFVKGGRPPELAIFVTGDVQGYLEPCG